MGAAAEAERLRRALDETDAQLQTSRRSELVALEKIRELENELRNLRTLEEVCQYTNVTFDDILLEIDYKCCF